MKIAIFSESYEPIINGVSVCVNTLRDGLIKRGHDVWIFAPEFEKHIDEYNQVVRVPSVHTFIMQDYPFPVPPAHAARKTFNSLKFDIVHTQTPFILGIMAANWAKKAGIPLVSTNHTLYTEYAHYVPIRPKSITRNLLIWLMRWYYAKCEAIVVPSNPVKDMLLAYGIKKPIEVIKTGVVGSIRASDKRIAEVRKNIKLNSSNNLILYVGRIAREKNLSLLLKAFKKVLLTYPDTKLAIVGGGPALNETKAETKELGIISSVTFTGMLNRSDLDPYYSAADIFVFPSKTETQGIAICEALSAGLPVVAVNAGGIPENIKDGEDGFLVNDDVDEFAEKLEILINDSKLRKDMGNAAAINACEFSIDRMVTDFEEFYRKHSRK